MLLAIIMGAVALLMDFLPCQKAGSDTRNLAYEAYCDSIYTADPDYYMDVLSESDEYCAYIEKHGEWWND